MENLKARESVDSTWNSLYGERVCPVMPHMIMMSNGIGLSVHWYIDSCLINVHPPHGTAATLVAGELMNNYSLYFVL